MEDYSNNPKCKVKGCMLNAITDSEYCKNHTKFMGQHPDAERKRVFNYNLDKFRARVEGFAISPALKNLHEEIGVLRMMLETLINKCQDDHDLMMNSTQISSMVCNIERLVVSANKLDINLGQLLDRNQATQLAEELIQIITEEIDDESRIANIASRITASMNRITLLDTNA